MTVGASLQGALPLDFVPQIVRDHGLADAHPWPLVSAGKRRGRPFTSRRVSAAEAWDWAELEYGRTPTSYAAVLVDLDGIDSADRLDGAILARAVQPPSWAVERPSSGGIHAAWTLVVPVHRYPSARRGPLDLFARVSEWYTAELRGDPGYAGVLAHNPTSSVYDARYLHPGGWSLEELADPIPADWRRPARRKLISAAGRNVTLFRELCRFAGRRCRTFYEIDGEAERINGEFSVPLDAARFATCFAMSIATASNGGHRGISLPSSSVSGAGRAQDAPRIFLGRMRASASREGNNEALRPWDAVSVSRRTWYRERAKRRAARPVWH